MRYAPCGEPMNEVELFRRLAVALAIGLLIGLERGWQTREDSDRERTAGLRTFALTGLLGGIAALVGAATSHLVLAAALLAYTASLAGFSYLEARQEKNLSVTGVVAGILTFILGAYATLGSETVAVAAAVAMAILLALRDTLHSWVRAITWIEMRSVLVLLAMSFLLLPILPNRPIDPWQVLNPAEIWLLAILIAGVSFAGYLAVRLFGGRRGLAVAAVAGGLASSTAATLSFSSLARDQPASKWLLAAGVLLAGATMLGRVLILVAVLSPALVGKVVMPVAAGLGVLLIATALLLRSSTASREQMNVELRNPFDLGTVIWLALLIGAITLAAKLISGSLGQAGTLTLAAVSGLVDVDAVTLSMLRLTGTSITADDAALAILLAVGANTAAKAVIATVIGGKAFGVVIIGVSGLALAAMLFAAVLAPHL
ncbi:MAG: MgtC/SapB family protein [Devosia sp.]|jgi:uncharacterized membrane protein (DUF4010 family)|nr:MgtC/SapB family protein [Devosia sp.]